MNTMLETKHFPLKITKTIEGGNRFSIFHLHVRFCTEKFGFRFKRRQRESIMKDQI